MTQKGDTLLSGGGHGAVRIWKITPHTRKMVISLAEHKAKVTSIALSDDESEFATSGEDGSCLQWDMAKKTRVAAMFCKTQFQKILYHPDQSQYLTTGSDRKITWWGTADSTKIRELDRSVSGGLTTLDFHSSGDHFVSGGADKLVKVWDYDEGLVIASGRGHSGTVAQVMVSPDGKRIVSTGEEGSVFIWSFPTI